jgi:hypothetical protein
MRTVYCQTSSRARTGSTRILHRARLLSTERDIPRPINSMNTRERIVMARKAATSNVPIVTSKPQSCKQNAVVLPDRVECFQVQLSISFYHSCLIRPEFHIGIWLPNSGLHHGSEELSPLILP